MPFRSSLRKQGPIRRVLSIVHRGLGPGCSLRLPGTTSVIHTPPMLDVPPSREPDHPLTATSHSTDIVAVARGAGIQNAEWVRDEAHFEALVARGFKDGGPTLLAAKIDDKP